MTDFLLELRSEEIPARMQAKARDDLARLFLAELAAAGVAAPAITTYATPRRLAMIARDLPTQTAAVTEETKGPKTSAPPQALDGFLRKTGLTRDQLVERDGVLFAVIDRPGRAVAEVLAEAIPHLVRAFPWPKSMRWGAASTTTESLRWVRPLQGIVALLDGQVVDCEVAGIASGRETMGHRFHSRGPVSIDSAATYLDQLRDAHVVVDQDERAQIIALGATMAARMAGLELIRDDGLLAENAGLTEWPVPLLGRFDEAFLEVPPEVIQLTARVNQKYFVCSSPLPLAGGAGGGPDVDGPTPNPSRKREGELANAFVCTANIDAADGGARIVDGNRKVLAARLADAKFFYDTDLKVPLEEQAAKLDRIVFHEKLGTVADKVARVAKLARWLVEEGIVTDKSSPRRGEDLGEGPPPAASPVAAPHPTLPPGERGLEIADLAERAALLCKADLVTGMVGEFPELQGVMGGYYALAQGEDPRVVAAIRDHYKPVGQGDDVPTDPVTVAVSLADKLDTIVSFFTVGLSPTGSRDPFAIRRAGLSLISIVINLNGRLSLKNALREAHQELVFSAVLDQLQRIEGRGVKSDDKKFHSALKDGRRILFYGNKVVDVADWVQKSSYDNSINFDHDANGNILDFLADRLKVQQREAGVRHDLIDAVFALGGEDDLVRLLARVRALQSFIGTEDGANLLAGYKRAANILKKEGADAGAPAECASALSYTPEFAETALIEALDAAEPAAAAAVAREDFEAAMAALATLREPIDAFFDKVTVNDSDRDKRAARLALLARVRDAVHAVADFSRIEG